MLRHVRAAPPSSAVPWPARTPIRYPPDRDPLRFNSRATVDGARSRAAAICRTAAPSARRRAISHHSLNRELSVSHGNTLIWCCTSFVNSGNPSPPVATPLVGALPSDLSPSRGRPPEGARPSAIRPFPIPTPAPTMSLHVLRVLSHRRRLRGRAAPRDAEGRPPSGNSCAPPKREELQARPRPGLEAGAPNEREMRSPDMPELQRDVWEVSSAR